ncbi:DUF3095 domain-containing protein [Rhizobiaceae bacterium n13]|uniref:DUF3095 domain-containing protein n=1 Tax=Ferirhizobium litorale TaxID=2927786 RepID=A0AAE3U3J1_9HYPH|nr:DUF3095 domain-containing protein [Fererhizobium litorale]MDI7861669.1 DUF3095 domain-containing protein [Fererhizobium litorale]MDI7921989.1 DUF3095 domain-containing protein [Fererhizobium litorale]
MNHTADDSQFSAPVFDQFDGVADPGNYRPLPDGWALAVADIIDSTQAIEDGRYKAVNTAGASVIAGVMNATGHHDLPFVFGGDGAVVAVPPSAIKTARHALAAVQRLVGDELQLTMRAALVPLADIRAAGQDVRVARFRVSQQVAYAMLAGGGSSWAESRMKEGQYAIDPAPPGTRPDLNGLSCRWNPIQSRHGSIASIIAVPGDSGDSEAFRSLVSEIVSLAGGEERAGHPVPVQGPELGFSKVGLETEARTSAPASRRLRRKILIFLQNLFLIGLFRSGIRIGSFDPRRYRQDLATHSDFRKFDDGLKMTIDVAPERLDAIEARLKQAEAEGIAHYGIHRQDAALMTCLVPTSLSTDHMHFIDGAAGGYATAARHLKAALQNKAAPKTVTP